MSLSLVWGRFCSTIFRDPGYWRLCHLYLVASNIILGFHILPSDGKTAWRIMCGGFYGLDQEVAILLPLRFTNCSHVTGIYLSLRGREYSVLD